jgi:ankyrin repeat protein
MLTLLMMTAKLHFTLQFLECMSRQLSIFLKKVCYHAFTSFFFVRLTDTLVVGANPTTVDVDGSPPVHIAAYVGNIEIIKCLIQDSHISPSTQDSDGNTPLHVACSEGHPGAVTLLLSLGADPALVDLDGETAIIEVRHRS